MTAHKYKYAKISILSVVYLKKAAFYVETEASISFEV